MVFPVWVNNLIAYTLQIAILAAAGTLLAYLFRLRVPRVTLFYWQSLLMICLFVFALQEWRHPVRSESTIPETVVNLPSPVAGVETTSHGPFRFKPEWIVWILVSGAGIRVAWLTLGLFRLILFQRAAHTPQEDPGLMEEMQLCTKARASILYSEAVDTPVTFGFRRPTVILPARFDGMSVECRRAVLCHELLHVRRHDWLFIIIEELIRSLFWFHPAIWWLLGRIHLCREQAVDYDVVRLLGVRQPYLDSLLEFARVQRRPRAVPAPLFLREGHLVQRIALLLKEVSMSRLRLLISLTGISVLLIGTVRLAAEWFPLTGEPLAAQGSVGTAPASEEHPIFFTGPSVPTQAPEMKAAAANQRPSKLRPVLRAENFVPDNFPGQGGGPQEQGTEANPPVPGPIRVGDNVQESKLIYKVEPVYPELAKRVRVSGKVILSVTANEEGAVSDVKVVSGHPLLVDAAVSAVKQWRYSPTLLNGMPVPVIFTVTCVFNFTGENDVSIAMDESGNLSVPGQSEDIESKMPKLAQGGTLIVRIATGTPIQVAEKIVQDWQERGVQRIRLTGPFALYQGKLFYNGAPATPPRLMPDIPRLQALLNTSSAQSETGTVEMFHFCIYVNEFGEIVGVQRIAGPNNPEIDQELMRSQVISPAMLGGNPVPFMYSLQFVPPVSIPRAPF